MADTKISEMSGTKVFIGLGIAIVLSLLLYVSIKSAWDKKISSTTT